MKNILVSLFILSIAIPSSAQLAFTKKSERLTEATGYRKCTMGIGCNSGEWVENKNMLYSHVSKSTALDAHSDQNFYWVQAATLSYKGKKYYVIYFESLEGDYEYPLTQAGWKETKKINFSIMSADEYADVKSTIAKKEGLDKEIKTYIDSKNYIMASGEFSEAELLGKISERLNDNLENDTHAYGIVLNSQTANGSDVVRFILPELSNPFDDLSTDYFEVKASDFKKLLID